MIIAVDFDGTCVTHEFPRIGKDIGAVPVLKRLVAEGHKLILWTMRSDIKEVLSEDPEIHKVAGDYLSEAESWFKRNDIPLWGVNMNPEQHHWTISPKAYAHKYIDDCGMGIPLIHIPQVFSRPFVDWIKLEILLIKEGILSQTQNTQ